MKKLLVFAALLLLLSTRSTFAWDDGGHMLVAQIAYSQLSANAKKQADELLKSLPDRHDKSARAYDFVTTACWLDDVRGVKEYEPYKAWHYIDLPCGADPHTVKAPNALTSIEYARRVLSSPSSHYSAETRARALAILLHVVGDIHQPLHCIDKDVGGNTFPISGVPDLFLGLRRDGKVPDKTLPQTGENAPVYQRLHAFWDSAYRYDVATQEKRKSVVALGFLGTSARPDLPRIESIAQDLTTHYLSSDRRVLASRDAARWVLESNHLACDFAIKTPRKRTPSNAYFARAHDIACQRLALAGYRLAKLLNEIFSSPISPSP